MSDKEQATRLADALQDLLILGGVHTDAAGQQAVQMLRRWPDGEPVKCGCHIDLADDEQPDECVFDNGDPIDNCRIAMHLQTKGKGRDDCEHWKPITVHRNAAPPAQSERIAALEAENARLRDAVADKVSASTLLTGMTTGPDGLRIGLEGGAASLLAEMLAQQFKDGGGINYLELSFVSRKAVPGDAFVVAVQRVDGKTPHALRTEAEAKCAALEEALEEARVALERIRHATAPTHDDGGHHEAAYDLSIDALRAIEEVRK